MAADFVFPKNNELKFIEIAKKLDISKLYFIYNSDDLDSVKAKEIDDYCNKHDFNCGVGLIFSQKAVNSKINSRLIIAKSSEKDRFLIEGRKVNLIYGFEEVPRKDFLGQKASGLNHIMCRAANKNNVAVGLPYSPLIHEKGFSKSILIGRMMQNIRLCQKYKTKTMIGAFSENPYDLRAPHDLIHLFSILGMSSKAASSPLPAKF